MSRIMYVINPAARGGSGSGTWERFLSQWAERPDDGDVVVTQGPGHAQEIAASSEGYGTIAAVAGDGTASEILCGIADRAEPRPSLAIIPAGTGNDIARAVGIASIDDAVAALRGGHARPYDLIRIDCRHDGGPVHRYAFLYCIVGFSTGTAGTQKAWMKRVLGPTIGYYLGTLLGVISYRAPHVTSRWEDQEYSGDTWTTIVGNAERVSGGSMCLCPGARVDDGEMNVVIVPNRPKLSVLRMMPTMPSGAFVEGADVSYFPTRQIEVDSKPPAAMEIDGDVFGTTPAKFTICPKAAEIVSPRP